MRQIEKNPRQAVIASVPKNVVKWLKVNPNFILMSSHPLLKVDISQLTVAERIQLAEDLWDSISERQEELILSEAQQQELDRRLESYQKNPANGSSWEEVKKRLSFSNEP